MDYQEHLLKNVFKGDKERFEVAWKQALEEGCEDAVPWGSLTATESKTYSDIPFVLKAINHLGGLPYVMTNLQL